MRFDFIEAIPSEGVSPAGWWAVIEGADGTPEIVDDCFDTKTEAEAAGREFKTLVEQGERDQRRERAIEEGTLQGLGAYNEIMGHEHDEPIDPDPEVGVSCLGDW